MLPCSQPKLGCRWHWLGVLTPITMGQVICALCIWWERLWKDCADPTLATPQSKRVPLPNRNGSFGGNGDIDLPPSRLNWHRYCDQELKQVKHHSCNQNNEEGGQAPITEVQYMWRAATHADGVWIYEQWKGKVARKYCWPIPTASPVHFGHQMGSVVQAMPYHVVRTMA